MSKYSPSSTWRANFRPHLDGIRKRWDDLVLNLVSGKRYQLKLEFDESYLIGDPESPIAIHFVPNSDVSGIEVVPPEGQLIEMVRDPATFSNLTWTLSTEHANPGPFHIVFRMPLYVGMPDSPIISGQIENVVIDSLTCDRAVTYIGYEVAARVLVLTYPSNQPVPGVSLKCSYAGQSLPDAVTNEYGVASFTFKVTDIGTYDLVVTLTDGFPDSKTQPVVVQALQPARVYGMSASPPTLRVGESSTITATVRNVLNLQPLEGRKVHWKLEGTEFDMKYTDASGKVETNWLATSSGAAKIYAYVYNQNNIEVGSVDVNVV